MGDTRHFEGGSTYASAGVDAAGEETALGDLLHWVNRSLALRRGLGEVRLPVGFFANVVDLGQGLGLAISTDGVGTKLLVAQLVHKYDTVGIDCVAMNVNDVLCVGAEPLAMVDCISLQEPRPDLLSELGKGLYEGARQANITIPGGEIAQVREMVRGAREGYAFDLVGTCVGLVPLDGMILGQEVAPGDVVVGLRSSGIHSNGLTLARRVLFDTMHLAPDEFRPELGRTVGEELLEPTRIYVREVLAMLRAGLKVKSLAHITSDGFLNLTRVMSDYSYVIDQLPEPPPVFRLIQEGGAVSDAEMWSVFNMGIGFCVVVPEADVPRVLELAAAGDIPAQRIGYVSDERGRRVHLPPLGLIGEGSGFRQEE
jgi:phosphoribosylformylglycinamidine cyclo-ligase